MMKNPLNKRFKRELRTNASRYAAILIIFIVMVTIISGFLVVANGVRISYDNDHLDNLVEDGQFSAVLPISDDALDAVESHETAVFQNYYIEAEVLSGQTLRLYQTRSQVNIQTVWDGELPDNSEEIAVERLFADKHGLTVGDSIRIDGKELTISALVSLPDYSSLFMQNTDLMPDAYEFGVAVVTPELFDSLPQEDVVYSYAYRYDDRALTETQQIDLSDDIKDELLQNDTSLTGFLMRQDNQCISFVGDDMGSDVPMMKMFLYIIQVIMAFVFAVIIVSTVESEAAVIGTLLASGYKKGELVRHYLVLPVAVILIGALIGNVLSYTAILPLFQRLYYSTYSLPPMDLLFNPEALLLTTLLPIVFLLAVNTIILYRMLSLSPLKFLRRDLRRSRQKRVLRLPNTSFMSRFRMRVILQNMGSYIILFFGMLFASFILLFGLCIQPTMEQYISTIEDTAVSEYQYILKAAYPGDADKSAERFVMHSLETYYRQGDKNLEVSFYGISTDSDYWNVDVNGLDEDSVILSDGLAKKLGVTAGETLLFTDPYNQKEYSLKIAGTTEYPAGFAAFMQLAEMNCMLENDAEQFSGYLSNQKLDIPEEYIATIITPDDMASLGEQMLSIMSEMSMICLAAAIVVYLVLMYILTKVVVDKNAQNISFMKVMGYQIKEIRKLYLTATVIAVIVSLLLSLPLLNLGLEQVFTWAFVKINGYLEAYLPLYLFAAVLCTGLASYLVINLIHMRRISKIGLAEVLKNRE